MIIVSCCHARVVPKALWLDLYDWCTFGTVVDERDWMKGVPVVSASWSCTAKYRSYRP